MPIARRMSAVPVPATFISGQDLESLRPSIHSPNDYLIQKLQGQGSSRSNLPPMKAGQVSVQHPYCPHCGNHLDIVESNGEAANLTRRYRSGSLQSSPWAPIAEDEASPASTMPLLSPASFRTSSSQRRPCAPLPSTADYSPETPKDIIGFVQVDKTSPPLSAGLPHPPLCSPRERQRLSRKLRAHSETEIAELHQNVTRWMQGSIDQGVEPANAENALGLSISKKTASEGSGPSVEVFETNEHLESSRGTAEAPQDEFELTQSRFENYHISESDQHINPQHFPYLSHLKSSTVDDDRDAQSPSDLFLRRQARSNEAALKKGAEADPCEEQGASDDSPPELTSHNSTASSTSSSRHPSSASVPAPNEVPISSHAAQVRLSTMPEDELPQTVDSSIDSVAPQVDSTIAPIELEKATDLLTGEDISREALLGSLAESVVFQDQPAASTGPSANATSPRRGSMFSPQSRRTSVAVTNSRRESTVAPNSRRGSIVAPRSRSDSKAGPTSRRESVALAVPPKSRTIKFEDSKPATESQVLQQPSHLASVDSLVSDSTSQTVRRDGAGNASGLPAALLSADVTRVKSGAKPGYSLFDTMPSSNVTDFVSDAIEEQAAIMTSRPVSIIEKQRRASQYEPIVQTDRQRRHSANVAKLIRARQLADETVPEVPSIPSGILNSRTSTPTPASQASKSFAAKAPQTKPEPILQNSSPFNAASRSSAGKTVNRRHSFVDLVLRRRSSSIPGAPKGPVPGVTPR